MFKCGKLAEFVPKLNIVFLVGFRRRICAEFNSHLDFFELLNLIRCGSNSAYELGLRDTFSEKLVLPNSKTKRLDKCILYTGTSYMWHVLIVSRAAGA